MNPPHRAAAANTISSRGVRKEGGGKLRGGEEEEGGRDEDGCAERQREIIAPGLVPPRPELMDGCSQG